MSQSRDPMAGKCVEVEWIDSASDHGWIATVDLDHSRIATCATCGYLVDRSKREVRIAQSRTRDGGYRPWGEIIAIPRVAVTRLRVLGPQARKARRNK
jgi:hypothetical protein